jgi:hypothetical protein
MPLIFLAFFASIFSGFLAHGFVDGVLILVKELGLLTNTCQWIRGLDST